MNKKILGVVMAILMVTLIGCQTNTQGINTNQTDCRYWDNNVCIDNQSQYYGCDICKQQCSNENLESPFIGAVKKPVCELR